MVLDMESDDSRASSPSNSSESRSNSPANNKDAASHEAAADARPPIAAARSARSVSTSSSSSNSSSSSSRSAISKNMKKSSSSSSGSGSGSSSSSGSSSEDEPDQEPPPQPPQQQSQEKLDHQDQPEPEAAVSEDQPVPSPSAKSQPSSFLSSVRSRSNSPADQQLYNQAAVDLNISHEDLSDVSDIEAETEKRASSKNSSPRPVDEEEDGAISRDSLPGPGEKEAKLNGKAAVSGGHEKGTSATARESKVSEVLSKQNHGSNMALFPIRFSLKMPRRTVEQEAAWKRTW